MGYLTNIKRIKGIILYGLLVTLSCGSIFGYGTGIIGNIIGSLFVPDKADRSTESILTSAAILGAFLGSPLAGIIADKFGRKKALIIGTVLAFIGNFISLFGSKNLYLLVAGGRLIFGLSLGFVSSVGPLYMAETSPDDLRGFLGVFFQFSITFTLFLSAMGAFFAASEKAWRYMLGLLFIPIGLLGVVMMIAPESPRFLIGKDDEKAEELLTQIYNDKNKVESVMANIRNKNNESASWKEVFETKNSRALTIGVILALAQQFTGINAIIYYFFSFADRWFEPHEINLKAATFAGLMGWNCLTSMLSIPLTKSVGRRTLMLWGQTIMFMSLLLSFLSFFFGKVSNIFSIIGIACFLLGFEISVGPLFFVVINEIFPEALRGRIGSLMTGLQWLFNFILTVSFPYIINLIVPDKNNPNGYVFLLFALVGVLTFVYQLFFLPETRNRDFDHIQELLQKGGTYFGKNATEKFQKKETANV